MVSFKLESWAALAPGLNSQEDWAKWLAAPQAIDKPLDKIALKEIPPLLRRRFNMLGKCAMGVALQLVDKNDKIPCVFASRHGDIALTLSLLEEMGKNEPMSPTHFSLAVHNAVSGLYTIARKDTSAVTAIAATDGLIINALIEAVGQMQDCERVLCVIYDIPLPELYQKYCSGQTFPYAIAMILNQEKGGRYIIEQDETRGEAENSSKVTGSDLESFMRLLTGLSSEMETKIKASSWIIKRQDIEHNI